MLYTFTGWDKSLTGITADTEVFAVFKGTVHMEIHNEEELERVRENLDGYYVLAADITLTKPWTPIGATVIGTSSAFTGVFDGDGHTISNVVIAPVNDTNGTNEVSGFFCTHSKCRNKDERCSGGNRIKSGMRFGIAV